MNKIKQSNNFDAIADQYDKTRIYPDYIHENITELIEHLTNIDPKNSSIFEYGVGTGRMAMPFLKKGYNYQGIDISSNMLSILKDKLFKSNQNSSFDFKVADATSLIDFENDKFDLVWGTKVLKHIPNWTKVLSESKRILKVGGTFIHGEEYWIQRPSTLLVRNKWEEFVSLEKERYNAPPGVENDELIKNEIINLGGEANILTIATWPVLETFRMRINHFANRGGSSTFGVTDETLRFATKQLEEWAIKEYNDLDKEFQGIKGYKIVIGTF
ncbi:class I SAM-dependent methyltransferase [Bacillus cereus]|uniref:Methyltransferase type 11 domain-containing protein n=1 Tax=Bacillus cereus HuA2-1 TaxID=1053201 RepID=J9BJG0_BACCE|nr:class I SAM-dependent methyltransferase [Bacillus cereus]EJV74135.1 hypothetical protein IG3_05957 [Bacillus cereus HuA2-1]